MCNEYFNFLHTWNASKHAGCYPIVPLTQHRDFIIIDITEIPSSSPLSFSVEESVICIPYVSSASFTFVLPNKRIEFQDTSNFIHLTEGVYRIAIKKSCMNAKLIFINPAFLNRHTDLNIVDNTLKPYLLLKTALHIGKGHLSSFDNFELNQGNRIRKSISYLHTMSRLLKFLVDLLSQIKVTSKNPVSLLSDLEIQRMNELEKIIRVRCHDKLTIPSLAREVGTNEQYAKNHFKMVYGVTIYQYILSCRMQKAMDLLLTRQYKISSIAEQTGYKHASHFALAFKKHYGYNPNTIK